MPRPALALPALAPLALAACVAAVPIPVPVAPADPGTCGADALAAQFVGQPSATVVPGAFPIPVRVIGPGDAVTMDYSAGRANFETDARGIVTRVFCG